MLRGRVISRSRETLSRVLPYPGDTERGSCLSGGFPHLARVRTPRTPVTRIADDEGNRLTWSESLARGGPSPASRGERVCSEKLERSKMPRRRLGASVRER